MTTKPKRTAKADSPTVLVNAIRSAWPQMSAVEREAVEALVGSMLAINRLRLATTKAQ